MTTEPDTADDSEAESDGPKKQTYRLTDNVDKVHRSGLVLEGDETIEAYPDILDDHDDVLEEAPDDE